MGEVTVEAGQVWQWTERVGLGRAKRIMTRYDGHTWLATNPMSREEFVCAETDFLRANADLIAPAPKAGQRWRRPGDTDALVVLYRDCLAIAPDDILADVWTSGSAVDLARWLLDNGYSYVEETGTTAAASPKPPELKVGMRVRSGPYVGTITSITKRYVDAKWDGGRSSRHDVGGAEQAILRGDWTIVDDAAPQTKAPESEPSAPVLHVGTRLQSELFTGTITRLAASVSVHWEKRKACVSDGTSEYPVESVMKAIREGYWKIIGDAAPQTKASMGAEAPAVPEIRAGMRLRCDELEVNGLVMAVVRDTNVLAQIRWRSDGRDVYGPIWEVDLDSFRENIRSGHWKVDSRPPAASSAPANRWDRGSARISIDVTVAALAPTSPVPLPWNRAASRRAIDAAVAGLRGQPFAKAIQAVLAEIAESANPNEQQILGLVAACIAWETRRSEIASGRRVLAESHTSICNRAAADAAQGYGTIWMMKWGAAYERAREAC